MLRQLKKNLALILSVLMLTIVCNIQKGDASLFCDTTSRDASPRQNNFGAFAPIFIPSAVIPDILYRESILVYFQADPRPCQRLQGQAHNLLV